MEENEMKISRIREGTVIDHIPSELCLKLIEILDLSDVKSVISVAMNLESKKMGKKALIKIGGKFFNNAEVNKITIVAPNVTMAIIKDYKVEKKEKLKLPEEIISIVKCNNPNCITNNENVETLFRTIENSPLKIMCHHCERIINKEEIRLC